MDCKLDTSYIKLISLSNTSTFFHDKLWIILPAPLNSKSAHSASSWPFDWVSSQVHPHPNRPRRRYISLMIPIWPFAGHVWTHVILHLAGCIAHFNKSPPLPHAKWSTEYTQWQWLWTFLTTTCWCRLDIRIQFGYLGSLDPSVEGTHAIQLWISTCIQRSG